MNSDKKLQKLGTWSLIADNIIDNNCDTMGGIRFCGCE